MVAKRKIAFQPEKGGGAPVSLDPDNPPKTVRRNARERNRVKQIDVGFEKLRVTIPTAAQQKKISRVKILSSAVDYIQHLHELLHRHEVVCQSNTSLVKEEPNLPTPPKSTAVSPHMMAAGWHTPGYHGGWQPGYPAPPTPHSPLSRPTASGSSRRPSPPRQATTVRPPRSPGCSTRSPATSTPETPSPPAPSPPPTPRPGPASTRPTCRARPRGWWRPRPAR